MDSNLEITVYKSKENIDFQACFLLQTNGIK